MRTSTAPNASEISMSAIDRRYGPMTPQVVAFFSRLRKVPAEAWAAAAAHDAHINVHEGTGRPGDEAPVGDVMYDLEADQMARANLRQAMETMPDVARRIRHRIDDDLSILDGIASRTATARMCRAARLAALALAARPMLSAEDFERLYRPFDNLIPRVTLPVQ